jgi:uncharacterized protein DUF4304
MTDDIDRKTMERALREGCVPELRRLGFKGSFPDFYRESGGFISLVNFQFYSAGGSFCINLSFTDSDRNNVYFRPETDTRKLRISQTTERHRLGGAGDDRWFSFGKTSYGEYRGTPVAPDELVATINELFVTEGEQWWNAKRKRPDQ